MTKLLASIVVAFAIAIALAPAASMAGDGKAAPGQKICRYKLSDGKIKTWTCGKDQPCCASETFGLFTCGSTLINCL